MMGCIPPRNVARTQSSALEAALAYGLVVSIAGHLFAVDQE